MDWHRKCLRLPDSKSGKRTVPLGAPALELLATFPKVEGNPYVLPSGQAGKHYVGLQKVWEKIRTWDGLSDVRIHDLRHSFGSVAALGGDSLLMIGKLLGHKDPKTTAIYTHLADSALQQAADRTANQIAAAMSAEGEESQVITIFDVKK